MESVADVIKRKPCHTHAAARTYRKCAIYNPLYYDVLRTVRYHDTPQTRQLDNDEDNDSNEGIEVDYTHCSTELYI